MLPERMGCIKQMYQKKAAKEGKKDYSTNGLFTFKVQLRHHPDSQRRVAESRSFSTCLCGLAALRFYFPQHKDIVIV
jgi:hypothetical protein